MDMGTGVPSPKLGSTRRAFLRGAAGAGGVALASLLAACGGAATVATGTAARGSAETATSTAASSPAALTSASATAASSAAVSAATTNSAAVATPAVAASSAAATTSARAAASVASLQGALKVLADGEPLSLDPAKIGWNYEIDATMRVFSNLLSFDPSGNLRPEMARAMPAVSADGRSYTFTLRDGLTYSDGQPLSARDFEYGWKRHLDPALASPSAGYGYPIAGAEAYHSADPTKASQDDLARLRDAIGVKATDDKTLVFTLQAPAPWFLRVLATWCGLPVRQADVERGGEHWAQPPTYIGNGPYVLTAWERQVQLRFKANPHYYQGAPPVKIVQYLFIAGQAVAFAAYRNNSLDVYHFFSKGDLKAIAADAQLSAQKHLALAGFTFMLAFNSWKPPFNDTRVRRAFSLALDRERYNHEVMGDLNLPANQFVPPGLPGHYDDLKDTYQHPDAERARQLLVEAGYPGGKGFPATKLGYPSSPVTQYRSEALAGILKEVLGVNIGAEPFEGKVYAAMLKQPATMPDLLWTGWSQDYSDPQDWYSFRFSSKTTQLNVGWKSDEYDQLCAQADQELDAAKRNNLYKQAGQILSDEAPVAFLVWTRYGRLVKPAVTGYTTDPSEQFFGQHSLYQMQYRPS